VRIREWTKAPTDEAPATSRRPQTLRRTAQHRRRTKGLARTRRRQADRFSRGLEEIAGKAIPDCHRQRGPRDRRQKEQLGPWEKGNEHVWKSTLRFRQGGGHWSLRRSRRPINICRGLLVFVHFWNWPPYPPYYPREFDADLTPRATLASQPGVRTLRTLLGYQLSRVPWRRLGR
jgi:hypothetical protein